MLSGNELYAFRDFRLEIGERLLLRNGERVQLSEKAFETLCVLVRRSGHLVTKDELLAEVWPDTVVEENNLDKSISVLRQVLGDVKGKQRFIETVRGRGYRFIADAARVPPDDGRLDIASQISSAPPTNVVSAPRRMQGSGNLAAVVSLADWRQEPRSMEGAHADTPAEKLEKPPSRTYWPVAIAAALCAALVIAGFYLWGDGKAGEPISSIAVLPFVNISGETELEYMSDGLAEMLIDRLSELPQLKVIARTSSFKYRGENIDLQNAARDLGVQAIVIGRVIRKGDDLSIRVELIDTRENKQLWGDEFNRKAVDAAAIQGEIARMVSTKLRVKLSGAQEQHLAKKGTDNPQAHDLLLKGDFANKKTATRRKALEYYDQAIALDPNYALAYARLAGAYQSLASGNVFDPKDVLPKVRAAAQKAVELDENLPEAHIVLATLARDNWDWTTAEMEYQRALELNPNFSTAHRRYSRFLSDMGRHEQAIVAAGRVRELDPQQLSNHMAVPSALLFARRFDESIVEIKKTLELGQVYGGYGILGAAYNGKGMYGEAITAYEEAVRLGGKEPYLNICLGSAYAGAGQREKALAILKQLETSTEYVSPGELPILYAALGEREKAFAMLEKAYASHDLQLQHLNADPGFDRLRAEPRFQQLVRRVGLPQ